MLRSLSEPKTTKLGTGRFWVIDVPYRNQHDQLVGVETFTGFGYVRAGAPAAAGGGADRAGDRGPDAGTDPAGTPTAEAAPPATPDRPARRLLAEVAEGDELPVLAYPVTATTVVLGALATRDWRPMHHDRDFAVHRNGARDIFLNTPNLQAWFERFVTDWAGPYGRPGRLAFRMRDSVYPGDTMTLRGTVATTEVDAAGCGWASIDITVHAGAPGEAPRLCCTARLRIALPTGPDENPWRRCGDRWRP